MNPIAKKTASFLMAFLMVANDLFALSGLFIAPEIPVEIEEVTTEEEFESPEVESTIDESSEVKRFEADLKYGIVGSGALDPLNSPSDDIFTIELSQGELNSLLGGHAYLRYEMRGVKDGLSIPKGINGSDTYGTMDFTPSETWSEQLEEIDSKDLWAGKNYVRFTIPSEYRASVEIRELEFVGSKEALQSKTLKSAKVASFSSTSGLAEYSGAKLFDAERTVQKGKVTALFTYETPSIPGDIINVTEGATAYRIESPSDNTDLRIRIPLDESKIPAGYTTRDVKTYYFDYDHKRWQELPRYMDEGGEGDGSGLTTAYQGGTDYINGVIQAPEMPAASAFVPTSLSDIKAAVPSAGMTMIQPPTINQQGTASIQYPLAIPKGRNGMQPNLALSYNSEGGESWVGLGWSINIPSISVDTRWGVPRFDGINESESYSLSGEPLVMQGDFMAHRAHYDSTTSAMVTSDVSRVSNARFFKRITNGYKEITRHGSNTDSYYWTVRTGDGTTFTYGSSDSSRLSTSGDDISQWFLEKVEDKWGNYIEYSYNIRTVSSSNDLIDGATIAHVDSIRYTGHGSSRGMYTVEFNVIGGNSSPTIRQDARLNKKMGLDYLDGVQLENITVYYDGSEVKNYTLNYQEGYFFKTLLSGISERRGLGAFYSQGFEYYTVYTDKRKTQIFNDNFDQILSVTPQLNILDMETLKNLGDGAEDFHSGYSMLGTSGSKGLNGELRVGAGITFFGAKPVKNKKGTFGGHYGRSGAWGRGYSDLRDVNGDGLPDLVFKDSGTIKYIPLSKTTIYDLSVGTTTGLSNVKSHYKTKDHSKSWGMEVSLNYFGVGGFFSTNIARSNTESTNYLMDYNSDGIMDVVEKISKDEQRVFFGQKSGSTITYLSSSELSPNPVRESEALIHHQLEDLTEANDIVKVWEAPFDGSISITGSASIPGSGNSAYLSIQKNNSIEWGENTVSSGSSLTTNDSFSVDRGDLVLFRCRPDSDNDNFNVTWNPTISYSGSPHKKNVYGVDYATHSSQDGFSIDARKQVPLLHQADHKLEFASYTLPSRGGEDTQFEFEVVLFKAVENASTGTYDYDSTKYTAVKTFGETLDVTDIKDPSNNTLQTIPINADTTYFLEFRVHAPYNVNWGDIDWRPRVSCEEYQQVYFPVVDYSIYNYLAKMESGAVFPTGWETDSTGSSYSSIYVQPELNAANFSSLNGSGQFKAYFYVGYGNNWINHNAGLEVTYNNGFSFSPSLCSAGVGCLGPPQLFVNHVSGERFYVGFYTNSKEFADLLADHGKYRIHQSVTPSTDERNIVSSDINVFANIGNNQFGSGYIGWGQFAWSGSSTAGIDTSTLTVPVVDLSSTDMTDTSGYSASNMEALYQNSAYQVEHYTFFPLFPERGETFEFNASAQSYTVTSGDDKWKHWYPKFFTTDNKLTAGVLGGAGEEPDTNTLVFVSDDFTAYALPKASEARSSSYTYSAGLSLPGSLGGKLGQCNTKDDIDKHYSRQVSEFLDLNGDGYEDGVTGEEQIYVQPTNPFGGHVASRSLWLNDHFGLSQPYSSSLSANGSRPGHRAGVDADGNGKSDASKISDEQTSPSSNPTFDREDTEAPSDAADTWNYQGSLTGAFSTGKNKTVVSLMDINGDGLPDRMLRDANNNDSLTVFLNTGSGFEASPRYIDPAKILQLQLNKSVNESVNFGMGYSESTHNIVKDQVIKQTDLSWSAGIGASHSWSNSEVMFMDINADGLVDQLYFNNSSEPIIYINKGTSFEECSSALGLSFGPDFKYLSRLVNGNTNINGAFTYGFTIPSPIGFGAIVISASVNGGVNTGMGRTHLSFSDLNGDGYVDILQTEEGNPNSTSSATRNISARYSQIGVWNKLKTVSGPLGGEYTVTYKNVGNKYGGGYAAEWQDDHNPANTYWDMPNSRFVMDTLKVYDGYDISGDGVDTYITTFDYDGGIYSRRDRQFLGFTRIRTVHPGGGRASIQEYFAPDSPDFYDMIDHHFKAALLTSSYEVAKGALEELVSQSSYSYDFHRIQTDPGHTMGVRKSSVISNWDDLEATAVFPAMHTNEVEVWYVPGNSNSHEQKYELDYDGYMRVTQFKDHGIELGSSADDIISTIVYHPYSSSTGICNMGKNNKVYKGNTSTNYIRRTMAIGLTGGGEAPQEILKYHSNTGYAKTTLTYDTYGNVTDVVGPPNYASQSATLDITYDSNVYTYPVKVENDFDYTQMGYDYNTGQVKWSEDVNGNKIKYYYDSYDRLEKVKGPLEEGMVSGSDSIYTIRFQYMPGGKSASGGGINANVPVALTYHYQPEGDLNNPLYVSGESINMVGSSIEEYASSGGVYGTWSGSSSSSQNSLQTATFVDGLGRTMQIKKDVSVWNNSSGQNEEKRAYSTPPEYDAYGRIVKEYQPNFEDDSNSLLELNSTTSGVVQSRITYDVLNRPTEIETPDDGSGLVTTEKTYTWGTFSSVSQFVITTITPSPQSDISKQVIDNRGRTVLQITKPNTTNIQTEFTYDVLGQLTQTEDPEGNITTYDYDLMGRMTEKEEPDAGTTTYTYDKSSNLTEIETQVLANSSSPIINTYNKTRLTGISYPDSDHLNDISLTYGTRGDGINGAGRVTVRSQGNSILEEEFEYDDLGNITHEIKTIWVPTQSTITYTTDYEYDTWGRMVKMTYPDSEELQYHYAYGGELHKFYGQLGSGPQVDYIDKIGYDHFGNRTYLLYGNGTETTFTYDSNSLRLSDLDLDDANSNAMLNKTYTYRNDGLLTEMVNTAGAASYTYNTIGGTYEHDYSYDNMGRLTGSNSEWIGSTGTETMEFGASYDDAGKFTSKTQYISSAFYTSPSTHYDYDYTYHTGQPNTLDIVADNNTSNQMEFIYDANGNMKQIDHNGVWDEYMFWDESNRLQADFNLGGLHHYLYDSGGERILKGSVVYDKTAADGTPLNGSGYTVSDYTVYVSPFFVYITKPSGQHEYTKHFYAGSERVASSIGTGTFNDNNSGGDNPTTESVLVHPLWLDNLTIPNIESILGFSLGSYRGPKSSTDPPLYEDEGDCEDAFIGDTEEIENCWCLYFPSYAASQSIECDEYAPIYWYHPDYLGNTEFVSDILGRPYQHFFYTPFGEELMSQHAGNGNYDSPYRFNAKEVDPETGYHYYGARYYNSNLSIWLSVDSKSGLFSSYSPYNFVLNNPIGLVDPSGNSPCPPGVPCDIENTIADVYRIMRGEKAILDGVLIGRNIEHNFHPDVQRPEMTEVLAGIVIHRTGGSTAEGAIQTSINGEGVPGFHIVIDSDGTISQMNRFNNRANHVGRQCGSLGISNQNSIGIEVVGRALDKYGNLTFVSEEVVGWDEVTDAQVEVLMEVLTVLFEEYGIGWDDIYPHENVSIKTPGEGQEVIDALH